MQDRGLAAYITELVGTLLLVFAICTAVVLFVATTAEAQTGSDFAVVGLVHGIVLFGLIITLGAVSGGHFNPAVTLAAAVTRRIDPVDAVVYMLAQLSGGVLGALLVKGLLLDEGRASHYGAATISPLLGGDFAGAVVEGIGTFLLVLAVCAVAFNPRARIGVETTDSDFAGRMSGRSCDERSWRSNCSQVDAAGDQASGARPPAESQFASVSRASTRPEAIALTVIP